MTKKILFGAAIALLSLSSFTVSDGDDPTFDSVLASRRSVRNYDATKKITEAEVRTLIQAAQEAPSWANQQPTKYYVAISDEKLKAVQDMVGGNKSRLSMRPCSSSPLTSAASRASSLAVRLMRWAMAGEPTTTA